MPNKGDKVTITFTVEDVTNSNAILLPDVVDLDPQEERNGWTDDHGYTGRFELSTYFWDQVEFTPPPKPPLPVELGTHLIATVESRYGSRYTDVELVRTEPSNSNDSDVWASIRATTTGGLTWFSDDNIKDWRLK